MKEIDGTEERIRGSIMEEDHHHLATEEEDLPVLPIITMIEEATMEEEVVVDTVEADMVHHL